MKPLSAYKVKPSTKQYNLKDQKGKDFSCKGQAEPSSRRLVPSSKKTNHLNSIIECITILTPIIAINSIILILLIMLLLIFRDIASNYKIRIPFG